MKTLRPSEFNSLTDLRKEWENHIKKYGYENRPEILELTKKQLDLLKVLVPRFTPNDFNEKNVVITWDGIPIKLISHGKTN